ncbi:MAG: hypothetical protein AUG51_23550 [Acidobacteria bacterium 13_1_20CM_3_53_8]|nr:MAG: hypothetical protein AUG51_23550 [Acidobacteria bacterium 13_1_20CM_3_53_8]
MNPIQDFLAQPFTQSIGWALVHFIWQGAISALLFAGARASLRRSSANVRYVVACFTLLLMLVLPVITTFIVRESLKSSVEQKRHEQVQSAPVSDSANLTQASDTRALASTQSSTALPETHHSFSFESLMSSQKLNFLMPWLVALWIIGVSLLSLRAGGGWVQAQRLRKRMTTPAAQVWQDIVARLGLRLRVSRTVRLCESAIAEVPTVIGWLRPVILLPASALTGLSREQMEALLAHELAHIRRYDYLVNLIQTAIETLLFYHPAVWWVSREIRIEREHACDDLAVAACGDVLMYARTLAELETLRASRAPQLAVAANGGSLLARIRRLVETPSQSSSRPTAWLASVIALVTVFSIWASASTALRARDVAVSAIERLREANPFIATSANAAASKQTAENRAAAYSTVIDPQPVRVEVRADGISAADALANGQSTQQPNATSDNQTPPETAPVATAPAAPVVATPQPDAQPAPEPVMQQSQSSGDNHLDYIDQMAALGLTNLTIDQLIEMKNHGVTPDFVRELRAAGYNVTRPEALIALHDHGVSAKYVREMASLGFNHLSLEELVTARDHGVSAEYAHAMEEAGYGHLSLSQIVAARDHGVSAEYIHDMAEAGYGRLPLEQVVAARDHGVSAQYVRDLSQAGYSNLSLNQVIALRDHGVSANFLKKVKAHGFTGLTLEQLIRLRDSGILD